MIPRTPIPSANPPGGQPQMTIWGSALSTEADLAALIKKNEQQITTLASSVEKLMKMMETMVQQNDSLRQEQIRIREDIISSSEESERSQPDEPSHHSEKDDRLTADDLRPTDPHESLFKEDPSPPNPFTSSNHHIEPPVLKKINVKEYEVFISDHKA
ncbi:hypothetical protein ADUPG1_011042, partial [Aduncisulcus paluster]